MNSMNDSLADCVLRSSATNTFHFSYQLKVGSVEKFDMLLRKNSTVYLDKSYNKHGKDAQLCRI